MHVAAGVMALLVAMLLLVLLYPLLSERGRGWAAGLFVVVFAGGWALGAADPPWGPALFGVPWLAVLVVALAVAAFASSRRPVRRGRARGGVSAAALQGVGRGTAQAAYGVFFWVLLALFLLALVARYRLQP